MWVIGGVCFCVLKAAQHIAGDGKLERFRQSHIWLHIYNVQIHQSKISEHFIRVKHCSCKGCNPTDLGGAEWNQCQVLAILPQLCFPGWSRISHFHLPRPGFLSGFNHSYPADRFHPPSSVPCISSALLDCGQLSVPKHTCDSKGGCKTRVSPSICWKMKRGGFILIMIRVGGL